MVRRLLFGKKLFYVMRPSRIKHNEIKSIFPFRTLWAQKHYQRQIFPLIESKMAKQKKKPCPTLKFASCRSNLRNLWILNSDNVKWKHCSTVCLIHSSISTVYFGLDKYVVIFGLVDIDFIALNTSNSPKMLVNNASLTTMSFKMSVFERDMLMNCG